MGALVRAEQDASVSHKVQRHENCNIENTFTQTENYKRKKKMFYSTITDHKAIIKC